MRLQKPKLLFFSICISQLAGIIGSFSTRSSVSNWYLELNKPMFNPPNWIFGPVWITLYTLMGVSLYLIWVKGYQKKNIRGAVQLFLIHLVVNTVWSMVFFGLKNLGLALLVIGILWLMIVFLIKIFWKIDSRASYLLIPYLLWVSFAAVLNYSIWILN